MLTIGGHTFEYSKFSQCFIPAFCCTVQKYQGSEIDEHYNIYNVNRMDKKQLYTALPRTTNLEYIHLSNELLNKRYIPRQQPHIEILNSYFSSDYNSGKIYEIVSEKCDKLYVGSTCQELQDRLHEHVTDKKGAVYKYRNDKLKIELLVYAPCKDKKSLVKV